MYIHTYREQLRKVDDNENSVVKHDRFLMSFQMFKSYIAIFEKKRHRTSIKTTCKLLSDAISKKLS